VQAKQAVVLRDAAEVELMRQTELRKEGLGSMRDFDRARFNLEAMKQEVAKAGFELERAKSKLEEDEIRLGRLQIRAPYDGIVSRRYAREGQKLLRDEKILRVTELRPLLVRFTVPEWHRRAAVEGNIVNVVAVDSSAGAARARVVRTGFVVDSASGTVECVAQLQEPVSESWVPGMGVEIRVLLASGGESRVAAVIPRTALRLTGKDQGEVFVVSADKLQKREVKLGAENADGVQVLSGVSAGERVALSPQANWQNGMVVRVRP
jgi:membrane fusion protein (multidrug efflux system)